MNANFAEQLSRLPDLLAAHMLLVGSALAAGACISLPLGVASARSEKLRGPALAFASTVQTVPALALLALMVPLVGRIGFLPAFIALVLYSMLPILRNTVVGVAGVDSAIREAALAVGMTPIQSLWRVELPLAAPVILAGARTATVWVVGAATLATPVGATSLGNYIFSGLQTRNWTAVLFGCFGSAALSLLLDQLLRAVEVGVAQRRPRRAGLAGAAFAALLIAGFVPALWPSTTQSVAPALAGGVSTESQVALPLAGRRVVIGAKTFTEQYVLARLIAEVLRAQGADAQVRENLGSTIAFDALTQNNIDLYVDYTGTIWANLMNRSESVSRDEMAVRVAAWLLDEHGIVDLGRLGFENAYGFAVTKLAAKAGGLRSIADLARLSPLSVGGDPEFFGRPEWTATRDAYGLQDAQTRAMNSTFMYGAARDGQVDAISAYTTDGRIDAFNLTLLSDPKGALPPYDAIIMLSPQAGLDRALTDALRPLLGSISPELMRRANAMVDIDNAPAAQAAAFLQNEIFDLAEPSVP